MSRILLYRLKTMESLAKRNQDHYQNRPIQVQIERVDLVTHPFNLEYITYYRQEIYQANALVLNCCYFTKNPLIIKNIRLF